MNGDGHMREETAALPPTTKELLGEHLHQKVSECLEMDFGGIGMFHSDGCEPVDKITGMLMERSEKDVHKMLQDDSYLLENVEKALRCCSSECPDVLLAGNSGNQDRQTLSCEELGEILYEEVSRLEEDLAPQITGMLLELDVRTLLEIVHSKDTLLPQAVRKAKEAVITTSKSAHSSHQPWLSFGFMFRLGRKDSNRAKDQDEEDEDVEKSREEIGEKIYQEVEKVHPDCAASLTGMILELDLSTVKQLLTDREHLMAAIARAHSVWNSGS